MWIIRYILRDDLLDLHPILCTRHIFDVCEARDFLCVGEAVTQLVAELADKR